MISRFNMILTSSRTQRVNASEYIGGGRTVERAVVRTATV